MRPRRLLVVIIFITLGALYVDLPNSFPINFNFLSIKKNDTFNKPPLLGRKFEIKQGLDLQGGTQVVLEADMSKLDSADRQDALDSVREVISRRVDLFGVSEPVIQTSIQGESYRLLVELPGVKDIDQALELIGSTAQLEFYEQKEIDNPQATSPAKMTTFVPTGLTGKHLVKSQVEFDPNTGKPVIGLQFNEEGAKLFEEITGRNIGKPVAISLDNYPVSNPPPIVNEKISGGRAVINGEFTPDEAKQMSIQLNAGALPVPVKVLQQRNIGASLGQESVNQSLTAGAVGLGLVMLFMFLYYGKLGLMADIALIIYGLITLALYKIIPITLTLPGLAGFILSIGMAVDSNILIFERMKEEIRRGKSWNTAMELGFGRAWDSIKDANVATLITSFILFNPLNWNFLNTSGLVRGFALTLALGILISLFTGVIITRTLLRVFLVERKNPKMKNMAANLGRYK